MRTERTEKHTGMVILAAMILLGIAIALTFPDEAHAQQSQKINAPDYCIVMPGECVTLEASAVTKINYQSADPKIATVSRTGLVTGKKIGTTYVTISAVRTEQYKKATKKVKVMVRRGKLSIEGDAYGYIDVYKYSGKGQKIVKKNIKKKICSQYKTKGKKKLTINLLPGYYYVKAKLDFAGAVYGRDYNPCIEEIVRIDNNKKTSIYFVCPTARFTKKQYEKSADIIKYLRKKGLADTTISALIGNMMVESSLNPSASRKVGDDMEQLGLLAWLSKSGGSHALRKYAKDKEKSWKDLHTQLDYLCECHSYELANDPYVGDLMRETRYIYFDLIDNEISNGLPYAQDCARTTYNIIRLSKGDKSEWLKAWGIAQAFRSLLKL